MKSFKSLMVLALALPFILIAQEDAAGTSDVEEVVVVGSQIKGANIAGVLPCLLYTSDAADE